MALTPKSVIFTSPLWFTSRLDGFMSLCITCLSLCKYTRPCKTWKVTKEFICTSFRERKNILKCCNDFCVVAKHVKSRRRKLRDLLTNNCKIWFKNCFNLSDDICQRTTIHVFQHKRNDSIVIERVVANNYMGTLCCLIYFQLLHNLFTDFLLYVHLDDL